MACESASGYVISQVCSRPQLQTEWTRNAGVYYTSFPPYDSSKSRVPCSTTPTASAEYSVRLWHFARTASRPSAVGHRSPAIQMNPDDPLCSRTIRSPLHTQDDIDAGSVESEATISGVSLSPSLVLISSTASDVTKLPRQHSISVEKTLRSITSAQGLNTGYSDAGDSGTFDIVVTNTGNTVLSTVKLTDDTFRDGMVTCDHDFSATTSRFLPAAHPDGVSIVCEGKVYLTSSHVDRGITGTAKVRLSRVLCIL